MNAARPQFDSIDAIIADLEAKAQQREDFAAMHAGRSFGGVPRVTTGYTMIVVSPCLAHAGRYRLTRFDKRGPDGHTEGLAYIEAVHMTAVDYGVDLRKVEIAKGR